MAEIEVRLHETAKERYLNYAMSVITSRALPDVRDGLKPVQRRLFKHTPLEDRFHVNLTCLIPTENPNVPAPARLDLKAMLGAISVVYP